MGKKQWMTEIEFLTPPWLTLPNPDVQKIEKPNPKHFSIKPYPLNHHLKKKVLSLSSQPDVGK